MAKDATTAVREAEALLAGGDARGAEAALTAHPGDAEAVNLLGNALAAQRRWAEAEACYRRAMELAPRLHKPLANLGNLLAQRGLRAEAIALYHEALGLAPEAFRTRTNLGHELLELGHVEDAVAAYTGALAQKPDHVPARLGLGRALLSRGEAAEALAEIERALAGAPARADLHHARGLCLERLGALGEAAEAHRRAVALDPGRPVHHKNLAIVLSALGALDEAATAGERAVALAPDLAAAHLALGTIRVRQARFDDGIACYRRALTLEPDLAEAWSNLGGALQQQGRAPEAVAHLRRALEIAPDHAGLRSNLLMALHYDLAEGPAAIAAEHREFGRRHGASYRRSPPRPGARPRLRVGYVSADLRDHSVARFIEPVFATFDRAAFEVFAYADVARPDRVTERLRGLVTTWRNARGLTDAQLADLVRRDGIDILVDLGGHSADNRLLVFAEQPAPVQVTYLGYPDTTGLAAIGYRLTDAVADPPGLTEALHVERLVRLPGSAWCYAEGEAPDPAPPPAAARGHVTFGCFNDFSKARPAMMTLWAEILRGVPGARLVLKAKSLADPALARAVRAFFAERGVSADRVEARGWARDRTQHLAQHADVDVALDTAPYHGTTTTCDALWMGVPVITLAGEVHVSRVGASLLGAVGLADLVARSPEEYVALAVRLVGDTARRAELRATLRGRVQRSPLGAADAFARGLGEAFRAMWREHVAGRGP
jgi:predicted O-linked N-acetylglucosamine transferase (SPINDLY family)